MRIVVWANLLFLLCVSDGVTAQAGVRRDRIPPPAGQHECAPDDKFRAVITPLANLVGALAGCYMSDDTAKVFSESGSVSIHRDYAFAMYVRGGDDYHFSRDSMNAIASASRQLWATYKPAGDLQPKAYRDFMNKLVADLHITDGSMPITEFAPVLIRLDDSVSGQYIVTTVRPYLVGQEGKQFRTVKVDSAIMIYKNGGLLRMDFNRELLKASDIDDVMRISKNWAAAIRNSGSQAP